MSNKVETWNATFEAEPANSDLVGAGNEAIQELKTAIQERLVQEHSMNLADAAPQARHGFHKAGSARVYVASSAPTLLPDGSTALGVNDAGRLWFRTTDSTLWQWDGTTWKDVASVGAAPVNHATSLTTYGVGSPTEYGHVKLHTAITDGVTDGAPDSNAVFDALALKADLDSPTFTGTVTAPSFNATSLRAKKTDIVDFNQDALHIIKNVKIVSFYLKEDTNKIDQKVGFIADDTHYLLATVRHNSMDMGNAIGLLLKAVQELSEELDSLKTSWWRKLFKRIL